MIDVEAVLFDFGGVFTTSPFTAVGTAAAEIGLTHDAAMALVFGPYDCDTDHPWHCLERGEMTIAEARDAIVALAKAEGHDLDPFTMLRGAGGGEDHREVMVEGVRRIRARGIRTAIVTNNVVEYRDAWKQMIPVDELFDDIVDSSEVGFRKPDPRIFRLALERLGGIAPDHAVFLDDAPGNVAGAEAIGIRSILVGPDPTEAMAELEALLDQA